LWANEEQRRDDNSNPTLVVVYLWSVVVFAGLVFYGHRAYTNRHDMSNVITAFIMFANVAFVSMMFLGGLEGGVQAEGPEIEEDGFYGQVGVLMFMTYLFWTIFSLVFAFMCYRHSKQWNTNHVEVDPKDYYTAPEVSVGRKV
jgi:predicted permease